MASRSHAAYFTGLLAVAVCIVLCCAHRLTRTITPAYPDITATAQGHFARDGHFPGQPLRFARSVRFWGSHLGDDTHVGRIALGPFAAPPRLRFAAGGYPDQPGNGFFAELAATGERAPILLPAIGERWHIVDFDFPSAWVGQPVRLIAIDEAKTLGGWLALSEPLRGGRGEGAAGLFESLAAWSVNGLIFGVLYFGAARALARRAWVPAAWLPLVALAMVANAGALVFWAYFAHPLAGKILSVVLLAGGAILALRKNSPVDPVAPEVAAVARLLVCIGLFYVALLHLFPSSLDFYSLAANRFREGLPGDNTLPSNVAFELFHGRTLRWPGADWLSSDRPPLQSGWQLLPWLLTARLGLDEGPAGGTAAIWLQLAWVPAAYALLRRFGLPRRRACAWVAVLSLGGFFAQHTVFTWPKLSAGAFACGMFALWVLPTPGPPRRGAVVLGANLAGLAWLSHGGVAFSLLALAPWFLWRLFSGEARAWAPAALVFALFAAPWLAYQKFYDPPGDRLLKWHLAGQIPKDTRTVWTALRESYRALGPAEILAHKTANLRLQIDGDWRAPGDFSATGAARRRNDEFFLLRPALTWWVLGLVALPFAWARARTHPRLRVRFRSHLAFALWVVATLLVWCLLMFGGGQTVIHQGSFAVVIALFALLSAWLERVTRWALVVVAVLQAASFASTWAPANSVIHGSPVPLALGLVLVCVAAPVVFLARAFGPLLPEKLGEKAGHTRSAAHR